LINITDLPMSLPVLGEGQKRKNPVTWNSQSEVPSGDTSGGTGKSHVTIAWLACSRALP
jgi:hypothetical protein